MNIPVLSAPPDQAVTGNDAWEKSRSGTCARIKP